MSELTLPRFYAAHAVIMPLVTSALIALHVVLLRVHGVTPHWRHGYVASGRAFHPHQTAKVAAGAFLLVLVLLALARFVGAPLGEKADPLNSTYGPRPVWYVLGAQQPREQLPGAEHRGPEDRPDPCHHPGIEGPREPLQPVVLHGLPDGHHVAVEARELAVLEEHGELALLSLGTGLFAPVHVIPAVGMENVVEQRRAEREAHLLLAHAGLELPHHVLRDVVALLDLDAIGRDAGNRRHEAAARKQRERGKRQCDPEDRLRHAHIMPPMSTVQSLKDSGLKATLPRRKILELFEGSKVRHLSAEDVYKALIAEGIDVGLATVYRVLTQFEQAGLLARQHFETGKAVFELNQGGHHDHLLCLQCGRVEEFYDPDIEKRQADVARQRGFTLHGHSLALYADCTKKNCPHRSA